MATLPDDPDEAVNRALDAVVEALRDHLNAYAVNVGRDWTVTVTMNDGWDDDQAERRTAVLVYRPGYEVL